jgi:acetyltransferase-like isoleucine patch superfamily enzyme
MISKYLYFLLKSYNRLWQYIRGLKAYLLINATGGECKGIPRVGKGVVWKYPPHKNIIIGKNVYLGHYSFIDVHPNAMLEIGDNVGITLGAILAANKKIKIGDNVLIGEYCSVRDADHGIRREELIRKQVVRSGEIYIDNDVWLGRNVTVLGKISIEKGIIVGANSFVNKDLTTEYGIYWGVPVKLSSARN